MNGDALWQTQKRIADVLERMEAKMSVTICGDDLDRSEVVVATEKDVRQLQDQVTYLATEIDRIERCLNGISLHVPKRPRERTEEPPNLEK